MSARLAPKILHGRDRRFDDTRQGPLPAGMGRANHARLGVGKKDGSAIGCGHRDGE